MKLVPAEELKNHVGEEFGTSDWLMIDQARIDQFADVTEDHQFIHVNEEQAKPVFGGTIAHGFLTLSLLVKMSSGIEGNMAPDNVSMAMNYGFDKVRFLSPVLRGKRVRAIGVLKNVDYKDGGRILINNEYTVEIEGEEKPALVAEWLTMYFTS